MHHTFSPSSLDRFAQCPASYKMSEGLEDISSVYAERGTTLHKCVETGDVSQISDVDKELVNRCIEFINEVNTEDLLVFHEQKIKVIGNNYNIITTGTADVIIINDNKATIIDWKFGYNRVDATSHQMQAYALGVMQEHLVDEVTAYIYQPAINHISKATYSDAGQLLLTIENVINGTKNLLFNASEDACRYCRAKGICPALKLAEREVSDTELLTTASDQELADLFEKSKIIQKKIELIKDEVEKRVVANGECAGYYYKERTSQEINSMEECYGAVKEYLSESELLSCSKVSVTQVRDLLASRLNGNTKKEKTDKAKSIISTFAVDKKTKTLAKK